MFDCFMREVAAWRERRREEARVAYLVGLMEHRDLVDLRRQLERALFEPFPFAPPHPECPAPKPKPATEEASP